MRRFTQLLCTLTVAVAATTLVGCGQSGPLYLPGAQAPASVPLAAAQT